MWGYMIIKTVMGKVIYETKATTFKKAVEEAVSKNVDLSHADFRRQKFYRAKLDGIIAPGATLWGADCRHADMSGADFRGADLRNTNLQDSCLAETSFCDANFSGAFFSNTILRGANLEGTIFSCSSILGCDLQTASNLHRAVYCHRGEINIPLQPPPVIIHGLKNRMAIFEKDILWGDVVIDLPAALKIFLGHIKRHRATMNSCS